MITLKRFSSEGSDRDFRNPCWFYRDLPRKARILWLIAVASSHAQAIDLSTTRAGHAATRLPNGQVLVTGGVDENGHTLSSAELYNPTTHTSTKTTGSMRAAREHHTSTLLKDGTVLITGGDEEGTALNTSEIYDPNTGKFAAT